MTVQTARGTLVGMDNETRHRPMALRFLISILQQYERDAPAVLRECAEELEALAREVALGPRQSRSARTRWQ